MAVWADIEEDDDPYEPIKQLKEQADVRETSPVVCSDAANIAEAHRGSAEYISHALRCFPIAEKLASYLDLTDLHSLSSTCHPVHDALVQFAYQLKQHSLRCVLDCTKDDQLSEDEALARQLSLEEELGLGPANDHAFPISLYTQPSPALQSSLGLSGKISRCARDMVAPCRKCGIVICRNCTEKSPSNRYLPGRLRRLCDACVEAPLILHQMPLHEQAVQVMSNSSASSIRSARSASSASEDSDLDTISASEVVKDLPSLWLRDPCTCATRGVYLCRDCGHNLRGADDIYQRVWKWRSRYSTHLGGGLGTGLGLGNQGQKCGRGKNCLATHDAMALMETECSEEVSTPGMREMSRAGTPLATDDDARHDPGYLRQEIEGIGGKVKVKSKRLVKVGATVYEYRDERETGRYLSREASGVVRSWCCWCARVCPGEQDKQ